ncbi:pleckstrin homology domain-containing family F member 1 [Xenentodon cancila]
MVDQLTFDQKNRQRISAVEISFGVSGKPLSLPGRVLIGEGRLMKQSRRRPQPKVFFLFNDLLVYGSIIMNGRWYNRQQIIPLEDIQLEDLEDSLTMKNQWLIRTPRKSFYVAAASYEEKQAWIEHITDNRSRLLQSTKIRSSSAFAISWIPDQASAICMRCSDKFSMTQRRHHCRKCGFIVCGACSKNRGVIRHIHPTKQLRICSVCHSSLFGAETLAHGRSNIADKVSSEEDEFSSEEHETEDHHPSTWMDSWSPLYLPQSRTH